MFLSNPDSQSYYFEQLHSPPFLQFSALNSEPNNTDGLPCLLPSQLKQKRTNLFFTHNQNLSLFLSPHLTCGLSLLSSPLPLLLLTIFVLHRAPALSIIVSVHPFIKAMGRSFLFSMYVMSYFLKFNLFIFLFENLIVHHPNDLWCRPLSYLL